MHVYLHLPFCSRKCAYCAFYSETGVSDALRTAYLKRVVGELQRISEPVETVYLGGGTPTLLTEPELEQLGEAIRNLPLAAGAEISCESNPETLTPGKASLLRTFVNRISIGIQSFDPALRAVIGRQCSDAAIEQAIEAIRKAGFSHANADLIYAIPGQTTESFRHDLNLILEAGVFDHFSAYSLTVEEGTRLAAERPEIDDDQSCSMYLAAGAAAVAHDWKRYEVSNYAAPGGRCRHNLAVWRGERYLGIGAGAAGFDGRDRMIQVEDLTAYLGGATPVVDAISPEARACEIAAVNLRCLDGWSQSDYERLNLAIPWPKMLEKIVAAATVSGVEIEYGADFVRLPEQSLLFWNSIAEEIICCE